MQTLSPGKLLYHETYRIERVLGQGGFGITYLATDLNLQRKVAIKEFFQKDYCDRDETTSRVTLGTKSSAELVNRLKAKFLKEARYIAKFDHPNIIRIHAAFEENNTAYYVMDYIEGESLSELVKKRGPFPAMQALDYIEKIGKALEYVHARKINHLDIKPANIMLRRGDNTPILIDFGLSKQYDSEGNQTSTMRPGFSHGYAPPEQYNEEGVKGFSPQTDIYALGATLYYLLSGVVPIAATRRHEERLTFPASIPSGLVPAIAKAMSLGRPDRQSEVKEFIRDLKRADNPIDVTEFVPQPEPPTPKKPNGPKDPNKPKNPNRRKIFLISAALIAVISGALYFLLKGPDIEPVEIDTELESQVIVPVEETEPVADSGDKYNQNAESNNPKTGVVNGHEWVDLGLSVKWATCNVGASTPSDYGNYYAWGETKPKSSYSWSNCFDYLDSTGDSWGVYKLGGKTQITPTSGHDTARENWGGAWRMPTIAELDELSNRCKWTWTTKNGHNGYLVTGPNGNSIFLPAAGSRLGADAYNVGASGYYWSSTLSSSYSGNARYLHFGDGYHYTNDSNRSLGLSVRPVIE